MKILYDYQAFYMQTFGGVSNSFVRLIEHLPKDAEARIAVSECNNIHLISSNLGKFAKAKQTEYQFLFTGHYKLKRMAYEWYSNKFPMQTSLGRNVHCSEKALRDGDFDVFHPTFYDNYFLRYLGDKPFVLTVHDMISELFSLKQNRQSVLKRKLVNKAHHIVAVSEKTKQDLMNLMNVRDDKITVIYHGIDKKRYAKSQPLVDVPYLLYVGNRKEYKNFMPMMRSLLNTLDRHKDIHVVCTGPDFDKMEISFFDAHHITERIIHLKPDDKGMDNLYENALCFIFPSMYEGFGIPILESWKAGCPVLLNSTSCFPEIAGDAAVFFHLTEKESDLADVMEKFLSMTEREKAALKKRQLQRLEDFSWEKSAKKLYDVYQQVCNEQYG